MNIPRPVWLACLLALWAADPAGAQERQFHAKYWQKRGGYYLRHYYYKPTPQASEYRYNLVIYYPNRPRHYYYFSPYTGKYWGRWDCSARGFSSLPPEQQHETIGNVREAAFPRPGPMPNLPESADNVAMLPPQGKLPAGQVIFPPDESREVSRQAVQQTTGLAEKELPRQFFSDWCREGLYYFRCCYYQSVAGGPYKSHRVIYYPSRPRYAYYFDPYKSRYWGRYDLEARGYALLREEERKEKLGDIPETAFPTPREMPPVPEATDNVKLVAPPRDLPE
jgi:hypothetical protein